MFPGENIPKQHLHITPMLLDRRRVLLCNRVILVSSTFLSHVGTRISSVFVVGTSLVGKLHSGRLLVWRRSALGALLASCSAQVRWCVLLCWFANHQKVPFYWLNYSWSQSEINFGRPKSIFYYLIQITDRIAVYASLTTILTHLAVFNHAILAGKL